MYDPTRARFDPSYRRSVQQYRGDRLYPDGPWKVEGRLDSAFVDWLAAQWLKKGWGANHHECRANVTSYFQNNGERLFTWWEAYHSETKERYEKAQMRLKAGVEIDPEEQQLLAFRVRALEPVPDPLKQCKVTVTMECLPASTSEFLPPDEALKQIAEATKNLSAAFGMPKIAQDAKPILDRLAQLNQDLADPILRKDLAAKVEADSRFEVVDRDAAGLPLSVELAF
jgi:hypothetical protein